MKKRTKILLGLVAVVVFGIPLYKTVYPAAPALAADAIRVACIGDSITYGLDIEDPGQTYPGQLQALLGDGYQVLNYGLSGRSLQTDALLPYTKERFFAVSQEAQPDIVLIMLGTNDTTPANWQADRFERDLEAFVQVYQGLDSAPEVYLLTCPPVFATDIAHSPAVLENEVIPIIGRVAAKTGAVAVDVFGALAGKAALFPDGLHPDAEGAAIIAETAYAALAPE